MIKLICNSLDKDFPYQECKVLYNQNQKYHISDLNFDSLVNRLGEHFWAILDDDLMGCIYFESKNNKLFLSGFSKRKVTKDVTNAIILLCNQYSNFTRDIYSETPHKHAAIALLRAGFKKVSNNIYKKEL